MRTEVLPLLQRRKLIVNACNLAKLIISQTMDTEKQCYIKTVNIKIVPPSKFCAILEEYEIPFEKNAFLFATIISNILIKVYIVIDILTTWRG